MGLHIGRVQADLPARDLDRGIKGDTFVHDISQQAVFQIGILNLDIDDVVIQRKAAHIIFVKDGALHPHSCIVHAAVDGNV